MSQNHQYERLKTRKIHLFKIDAYDTPKMLHGCKKV